MTGLLKRGANTATTDVGSKAAPTASTEAMVKSFLFSKPSLASTAFASWSSATRPQHHHHQQGNECHSTQSMHGQRGTAVPSHCGGHGQSAGAPPPPETQQPDKTYMDAQAHRRAATTAWKRRSFVEQVNEIPHHFQHKSVVPAVPISPRCHYAEGGVQSLRPSTGGSGRPSSGILPVGEQYRLPHGHPLHASSAQLGWVHLEDLSAHQRTRRALAARVAHVTDYAVPVQLPSMKSSGSIRRSTSAAQRPPPSSAPIARLSREHSSVTVVADATRAGDNDDLHAHLDAPPRALDTTAVPDAETKPTTLKMGANVSPDVTEQEEPPAGGANDNIRRDGEGTEIPSRNSSITPSGGIVLRRRRRSSPSQDATSPSLQAASGGDSGDTPSLGASQRSALNSLANSQSGGQRLSELQPVPPATEEDAELLDEGVAAASMRDDDS